MVPAEDRWEAIPVPALRKETMISPAARAQAAHDAFDAWWSDEGWQYAESYVRPRDLAKLAYLKAYIDALEATKQDVAEMCKEVMRRPA